MNVEMNNRDLTKLNPNLRISYFILKKLSKAQTTLEIIDILEAKIPPNYFLALSCCIAGGASFWARQSGE